MTSTDLDTAMNKVIAFSLWGNNPRYTQGMVRNAELAQEIYPDWAVRCYTGEDVNNELKAKLKDLGVQIVEMGGADWNGMFWRFLAADSDDTMMSRDADSRLSYREKLAVDEWLDSDKDFHIMRDHQYHGIPILGGMWGVRNGALKGMRQMIEDYDRGEYDNRYQVDQKFLEAVVYPLVVNVSYVHDEFFQINKFPGMERNPSFFVGQAYDGNDKILDAPGNFKDYISEERKYYESAS